MDWSGFEPEASGLQNRRSSELIYQPSAVEGRSGFIAFRLERAAGRDKEIYS